MVAAVAASNVTLTAFVELLAQNSSSVNVSSMSAAATQLTVSLESLSVEAITAVQSSLLAGVAATLNVVVARDWSVPVLAFTAASAATAQEVVAGFTAASIVATIVTVPDVTLSLSAQAATLAVVTSPLVLFSVVRGPTNRQDGGAGEQNSTAQLTNIALAAVSASARSSMNLRVLAAVQDALGLLIAAQVANLQLTLGAVPHQFTMNASTSSGLIQTAVIVVPAYSRAFATTPITAPGSLSWFAPMPKSAAVVNASTPLVATFMSLAFDPHAWENKGAPVDTPGATRLEFSTPSGVAVELANSSELFTFTMPAVNVSGAHTAQCAFWQPRELMYATAGCITLPNPSPPYHVPYWLPGYVALDDAALAAAWDVDGPGDANDCESVVLDCGSDAPCTGAVRGRNCTVQLDVRSPLLYPGIACNVSLTPPPVLRIFTGSNCPLWRPGNVHRCNWDATVQAFVGDGCVAAAATRCACRHLTDFVPARVPQINTCSATELLALTPSDIVDELRLLFYVVIFCFAGMNAGAVVGFALDMLQRRATLARFLTDEAGFVAHPDGAWTWVFRQQPCTLAVEAPAGSAVRIAWLVGIPFIRLRAALPEELLSGTVAQALGRKAGLSVAGLRADKQAHDIVLHRLRKSMRLWGHVRDRIPALLTEKLAAEEERAAGLGAASSEVMPLPPVIDRAAEPDLRAPEAERCVRISLCDAPPCTSAPVEQAVAARSRTSLMQQTAASNSFILRPTATLDDEAAALVGTALVLAHMANAHVLPAVEHVMRRDAAARHFEGVVVPGMDADFRRLYDAFLLMLGPAPGGLACEKRWLEACRLWRLILLQGADGAWSPTHSLAFALHAHDGDAPPVGKLARGAASCLHALGRRAMDADCELHDSDSDDQERQDAGASRDAGPVLVTDCPLSFSGRAVQRSMPAALRALRAQVPALRIWATVLVVHELERLRVSWLMSDEPMRTIVDMGTAYLAEQGRTDARVAALLADGTLNRSAAATVHRWMRVRNHLTAAVRNADVIGSLNVITHVQRAMGRVAKSMLTNHETFSTFLDADSAVMRWQRWMCAPVCWLLRLLVLNCAPTAPAVGCLSRCSCPAWSSASGCTAVARFHATWNCAPFWTPAQGGLARLQFRPPRALCPLLRRRSRCSRHQRRSCRPCRP